MPDIFDEVGEDLRAELFQRLVRRFGWLAALLVVAALIGTGVFYYQQDRQQTQDNAAAARFIAATADKIAPAQSMPALAELATNGPAGYRVLARLRLAALQWQTGAHDAALASWDLLAADPAAPTSLRDLATLSSVQHQLDRGDPAALKIRLLALTNAENPWRPLAEQVIALLELRQGKPAEASATLTRLSHDASAPQSVRQLAADLLQTLAAGSAPTVNSGTHG